jgi:hypothetical protein
MVIKFVPKPSPKNSAKADKPDGVSEAKGRRGEPATGKSHQPPKGR